jgi:hypothetical protein
MRWPKAKLKTLPLVNLSLKQYFNLNYYVRRVKYVTINPKTTTKQKTYIVANT